METIIDKETKKKLEDRLDQYSKYGTSLCYLLEEKRANIKDFENMFFAKDDEKSCFVYGTILKKITSNDLNESYKRYSNLYPNKNNDSNDRYRDNLNKVCTRNIINEVSGYKGNKIDRLYVNTYNYLLANYNIK